LNQAWTAFGRQLNGITSPMLLAAVYSMAITPTAWLMRAMGKDPMRRRRDPGAPSYWIPRSGGPASMTRQF
jgi:hypothetical protein